MAVIKQTTQFVNRPIGVVRASEGGQRIGQAISAGAENLANDFYREAAVVAQETGQKEAMAQSGKDIVSIDPETGNPVAYKAPDSYGSIASRAYQDLIDRRFQESLVEEIQEKGAEFASSAGSAAAYKAKMSQYVGEMYKSAVSADGELNAYGRQIKEAGEKYVASTYSTLRKREIAAYKKRIARANKLEAYKSEIRIQEGIASVQDPQVISDMLDAESVRNLDLLNAGGSVSAFIKMDKKIRGQRALVGQNQLVGIYSESSDADRLKVEQAIVDPSKISSVSQELGIDNLGLLIAQSGGRGNASSTLSGLRSVGAVQDSLDQVSADDAFIDLEITTDSTVTELERQINRLDGLSEAARGIVRQDMYLDMALKGLDASNLSSNDMSVIANQLQSEDFRLSEISKVLPEQYSDNVILAVNRMTSEQRSDLAGLLTDRQTDLRAIETDETQAVVTGYRQEIMALEDSKNLIEDYGKLRDDIKNSGLDNAQMLMTNVDENFVENVLIGQRDIPVSANAYRSIERAVKTGESFQSTNNEEANLFRLLDTAYRMSPTTVSSEMERRGKQLDSDAKERVDGSVLSSIKDAALAGKPLQPDDLKALDKAVFGDKPFFLAEIGNFPEAAQMFSAGTILPTVRRALAAALDSNSEDEIEAGAIMFRQASTASGVISSGESVNIDLMRSALSAEDYALYQSLMYANERFAESPTSTIMTLRNYEGDLNADLLNDFGVAGKDVMKIFEGAPAMSPQYKREILASLQVAKAKGGRVNQDTLDRLIGSYQEFTNKDESVIGPYVGDETVYARTNYVNQSDILGNKARLTDALVDSGTFDDLLTGGTFTDSALASFQQINPLAFVFSSLDLGASMFGDMSRMEKAQARNRLKEGLAAIDVPLLYRPNVQSFNNGVPSWDVGYDDGFGFEPIVVNGEVWTLTSNPRPSLSRGDARFQSRREFNNAALANAPIENLYSAEIKHLATLEHMTPELFRSSKRFQLYERSMSQDPSEVFDAARQQYEELP